MTEKNQSRKKGRNTKELSYSNKLILMGLCGGICEFPGCGQPLFEEQNTTRFLNLSNFGHIKASSPDGPRGDRGSHTSAVEVDNFIVLCQNHHNLIDSHSHRNDFSEKWLIEKRNDHRKKIKLFAKHLSSPDACIVTFTSPIIAGKNVEINVAHASQSVFPDLCPTSDIEIKINLHQRTFGSVEYWQEMRDEIDYEFNAKLMGVIKRFDATAVFGLAPIPCLAYLGFKLGNAPSVRLFPVFRDGSLKWKKNASERNLDFSVEKIIFPHSALEQNQEGFQALLIEISANISPESVKINDTPPAIAYSVRIPFPSIDAVQTQEQLAEFCKYYIQALDKFDASKPIYVFAAAPQTVAIELGRQILATHGEIIVMSKINQSFIKGLSLKDQEHNNHL